MIALKEVPLAAAVSSVNVVFYLMQQRQHKELIKGLPWHVTVNVMGGPHTLSFGGNCRSCDYFGMCTIYMC